MKTIAVLDTPLAVTDYDALIENCVSLAQQKETRAIDFTNTHIVTMRRSDPGFRRITGNVDYFIPDGMPLIWCLNRMGAGLKDRVYGPTFMRRCIAATPELRHYFLGGSPECLEKLVATLRTIQPELRVAGARDGYFAPGAEPEILAEINRVAPHFIWVGLGTPKQQDWIFRNKTRVAQGVIFAVGFAFDVNAGMKADAPAWMQRMGLTWLFRLVTEPRRLLTRYVRYNTLFLCYLLRDALVTRREL